jgi:hypothetical protein
MNSSFKKDLWVCALTVLCIALDFAGRSAASSLELPVWLDTFGTALAAYALGPLCGAMAGATFGVAFAEGAGHAELWYAACSVAVGICVGFAARRGAFKSLFGVLSLAFIVALISTAISVPIDLAVNGGSTSNPWGDGVISFFDDFGTGRVFSCTAGQFYLEFVDKAVTMLALYAALKIGSLRKRISL